MSDHTEPERTFYDSARETLDLLRALIAGDDQ